jgi:hypothetical protein
MTSHEVTRHELEGLPLGRSAGQDLTYSRIKRPIYLYSLFVSILTCVSF